RSTSPGRTGGSGATATPRSSSRGCCRSCGRSSRFPRASPACRSGASRPSRSPGASPGSSCSRSSASRSASARARGRTTCTTWTTPWWRRSSWASRCSSCAGGAAEGAARRCRTPERAELRLREAIALGLLHGPAELLPVSSSGHVRLVPWLAGWDYPGLDAELRKAFEVALHAGTAAALLVALRAEVGDAARGFDRRRLVLVAGSFVPPAIVGYALERPIERHLGTPPTIAAGLVVGAAAMALADACGGAGRRREDAGWRDALAPGLAQTAALVPGVPPHGATLAAARARGFD